jgi:hypothetical protein
MRVATDDGGGTGLGHLLHSNTWGCLDGQLATSVQPIHAMRPPKV